MVHLKMLSEPGHGPRDLTPISLEKRTMAGHYQFKNIMFGEQAGRSGSKLFSSFPRNHGWPSWVGMSRPMNPDCARPSWQPATEHVQV